MQQKLEKAQTVHKFHDNFNSLLDKFMSTLQDESHSEVCVCVCVCVCVY